jgi:flagellar hook assembly protein FlgD
VRLVVYGLTGQRVRLLAEERQEHGSYEITWDGLSDEGGTVASGVYLVRLESGADLWSCPGLVEGEWLGSQAASRWAFS